MASDTLFDGQVVVQFTYSFLKDGAIEVDFTYTGRGQLPILPRVGMLLSVDSTLNQIKWYGPGPEPTYPDRSNERIGLYEANIMENWVNYSQPQENGNKEAVRWLQVTNRKGQGIIIEGDEPFSGNIWPFSSDEVMSAKYDFHLKRNAYNYLFIDKVQMGVGGDSSWGATAHKQYLPRENRYQYTVRIAPFKR